MDSTDNDRLYHRSLSISNAFGDTFNIFKSNWKPMLTITFFQILSYVGVGILYGIILMMIMTRAMVEISSKLPKSSAFSQSLVDYGIGSGASRALEYYGESAGLSTEDTESADFDAAGLITALKTFTGEIIIALIIFIFLYAFVGGIFTGAMYHAVAEVYAGDYPTASKSIGYGWTKKWQVYFYNLLLFCLIFVVSGIVLAGSLNSCVRDDGEFNLTGFILMMFALIIFLNITATLLIAGVPSIIVESKSAIAAFGRSWNLCKSSCCYIFCSIISFNLLYFVLSGVINLLPDILAIVLRFCTNMAMLSLGPTLVFVLYMSTRVNSENITKDELRREIGSDGIELAEYSQNVKAEYA